MMLLMPDLFGSRLSGIRVTETTNASTTGLFDLARGSWMPDLAIELGIPARILAPLRTPGERLGPLLDEVREATGLGPATG